MTEADDFETIVRHGMEASTQHVVAGPELQGRLIDVAAAGRSGGLLTYRRFPSTWALPAAAAVITVAVAGSALAVRDFASGPSTVPGSGTLVTAGSSPVTTTTAPSPTSGVSQVIVAPTSTSRSQVQRTSPTGSSSPSGTTSSDTPSGRTTPTSPRVSNSSPSTVIPTFPRTCTKKATGTYEPRTEQQFIDYVVGSWLVCSHPSIFTTDEDGLLISRNRHWAKLYRNASGKLIPATNPPDEGTWQVVDVSQMNGRPLFQINLKIDGSGTIITIPVFATGVTRMHLDNNGDYNTDYVPA